MVGTSQAHISQAPRQLSVEPCRSNTRGHTIASYVVPLRQSVIHGVQRRSVLDATSAGASHSPRPTTIVAPTRVSCRVSHVTLTPTAVSEHIGFPAACARSLTSRTESESRSLTSRTASGLRRLNQRKHVAWEFLPPVPEEIEVADSASLQTKDAKKPYPSLLTSTMPKRLSQGEVFESRILTSRTVSELGSLTQGKHGAMKFLFPVPELLESDTADNTNSPATDADWPYPPLLTSTMPKSLSPGEDSESRLLTSEIF